MEDEFEGIRPNEITGIYAYLKSLDWKEPWLYWLLAAYLTLFLLITFTKRYQGVQFGFFCSILLVVYQAEPLNEYLSKNHRLFTRHQYFDSPGLFISVVFSAPLLFFAALIVVNWLWTSAQLLREGALLKAQAKKSTKKDK